MGLAWLRGTSCVKTPNIDALLPPAPVQQLPCDISCLHAEPGIFHDQALSLDTRASLQWLRSSGRYNSLPMFWRRPVIGRHRSARAIYSHSPAIRRFAEDEKTGSSKGAQADSGLFNEQPASYADDRRYAFDLPYYGFQHVDMVTGHGDKCNGHCRQWLRQNCPDWKLFTILPTNCRIITAARRLTARPCRRILPHGVADRAIDWIGERTGDRTRSLPMCHSRTRITLSTRPENTGTCTIRTSSRCRFLSRRTGINPPMQWMDEQWRAGAETLTRTTACRSANSSFVKRWH